MISNKLKIVLIVIPIIALGFFMRSFQYRERFMFNHDNDLASWMVRDIVVNRHLRLVGQETSARGIFIGPLFYYALVPLYLVFHFNPLSGILFSLGIGTFAVFSIFYTVKKLYGLSPAVISSLIYAASFSIVINEREVVPTVPVLLWSIWFYYSLHNLFSGKTKYLYHLAVLFALIWHLNLALILLAPLVVAGMLVNVHRLSWLKVIRSALVFILLSLPLIVFEFRHGFLQTKSLFSTIVSIESKTGSASGKLLHVLQYSAKNANSIFLWDWPKSIPLYTLIILLLAGIFFLAAKKAVPKFLPFVYSFWIVLYLIFFSAHPINLSEYYLNGMNILWIVSAALLLAYLAKINIFTRISVSLLVLFLVYLNVTGFITSSINNSGYLARSALVDYVSQDAAAHGYPCVAVSYITNPGYNLGYRYLFWRAGLHVNQPQSQSPVYTIVFPHPLVEHLDKTFGALGLILPNYSQYDPASVKVSCSGADSNITDPMFGFTQ